MVTPAMLRANPSKVLTGGSQHFPELKKISEKMGKKKLTVVDFRNVQAFIHIDGMMPSS